MERVLCWTRRRRGRRERGYLGAGEAGEGTGGGVAQCAVVRLAAGIVGERGADIPERGVPTSVRRR
jgi:hypothetical protein